MGLLSLLRRRYSPLPGIMTTRDFLRAKRSERWIPGRTHVAGRPIVYSDKSGLLHSAAEIFQQDVYKFNSDSAAPHIIDAGANIGLSVVYFKTMFPDATIVAYEPDAQLFAMLKENTSSFSGIDLRQAAVWTENTELTFFTDGSLAGSLSVDFEGRGLSTTVRAERLRDEIVKRHVDFLKIDVEGAENEVLFDIEDALPNVTNLFFEYHSEVGAAQRLGDLLKLVSRQGFRYTINGPHGAQLPFVEMISRGFDLQLNVSCVRPA